MGKYKQQHAGARRKEDPYPVCLRGDLNADWAVANGGQAGTSVQVGAIVRHDVGFSADFARMSEEILASVNGPVADRRKGSA